jgi:hypothetical protein
LEVHVECREAPDLGTDAEDGNCARHIDPTRPDVQVPQQFKRQESLMLNLSRNFGHQLSVNDNHIQTVLSFNKVNFPCILPWPSIFDMVNLATQERKHWISDIPESIRLRLAHELFTDARQRAGKRSSGLA